MVGDLASTLVERYIAACGDHCEPYLVLERLEDYGFEWDDKSLSELVYRKTKHLGCIPCEWSSMEEGEGRELLKNMLGKSLMMEYPPFGKSSEAELSDFLNQLHLLIGAGLFLSNTTSYGKGARAYGQVFPESERYDLDIGISIVTGEWFVFFAHRGLD